MSVIVHDIFFFPVDQCSLFERSTWMDAYVFERLVSNTLDPVGGSVQGSPLRIYTYADEQFWAPRTTNLYDWLPLLFSLIKLAETFTLWSMGEHGLYWICSLIWIY